MLTLMLRLQNRLLSYSDLMSADSDAGRTFSMTFLPVFTESNLYLFRLVSPQVAPPSPTPRRPPTTLLPLNPHSHDYKLKQVRFSLLSHGCSQEAEETLAEGKVAQQEYLGGIINYQ